MGRQAFNFYRSYYDVYQGLNDVQKLTYMDTLLKVNFLEIKVEEVAFKDPVLQLVWQSQKHSVNKAVKGYLDGQKRKDHIKSAFFGCYSEDYHPTEGPTEGPTLQGKEKEKGKEEGEGKEGVNPDNTPEDLPEIEGVGKLLNDQGLMPLETAKDLMRKDEAWQKRVLHHLKRFDHVLTYHQLDKLIEQFFLDKSDEPDNLREGVLQYQLWFKNWVKVELKKRTTQKPDVVTASLPQSKKLS